MLTVMMFRGKYIIFGTFREVSATFSWRFVHFANLNGLPLELTWSYRIMYLACCCQVNIT